ncbi:type II toxin-antitoxin system VapC family toxin [Deinococcus sp. QL22]|uniref:type II toxin-antitoxin system VapC family toxin n=1 Tax=Deinococcus sp. QL22 TaxID=2939437 RepID=UPI002016D1D3|nr:hypothetical protein [Deinococcus sp. QL22]UQN08718.1 hypothetical protein M1R55_21615 [Deinococcus sp. QL22]
MLLFDASALMAYLLNEDGRDQSLQVIASRPCFVSSVTFTELEGKRLCCLNWRHSKLRATAHHV